MKRATKKNLVITVLALASIPPAFGLVALAVWAGVWAWFKLVWWTGVIFFLVAIWYGRGLRRARPLCAFAGAVLLHLAIVLAYVRSAHRFPSLSFRIMFGPVEMLIVGALLMLVGGPPENGGERRSMKGDVK